MEIKHPNFYFDADEIEALKRRIDTDTETAEMYQKITEKYKELLAEDFLTEEYANSEYSQHGKYYEVAAQVCRMNEVLGSRYLIEGDKDCCEKLKKMLLHFSTFKVWAGPDNPYQEVPRKSELTTAGTSIEMAYAYDIVYNEMTEEERETVAHAIIDKGVMPLMEDWVLPETRIHAIDSMGHNWWAVCIANGVSALLPVAEYMDEEKSERIISLAEEALSEFLTYPGSTLYNKPRNYDNGLFYESANYFAFGTGELLKYIYLAERCLGVRDDLRKAIPDGMSAALFAFAYPTKKEHRVLFFNWGDGHTDADVYRMTRWLTLLGYNSPEQDRYAVLNKPVRDFFDLFHPELHRDGSWDDLPKNAFFPESGYAFLRSGFEEDATALTLKSGYTWNHSHADAGSFMLWDRGRALIDDGGSCNYSSRIYRSYYCKDEGHNLIMFSSGGQNPEDQIRGNKFRGRLCDIYEGEDFAYVCADATGPVAHICSRNYRNFIWIENRILIILDDIRTHKEETLRFLLHFDGEWVAGEEDGQKYTDIKGEVSSIRFYHNAPDDLYCEDVTDFEMTEAEDAGAHVIHASHLEFRTAEKRRSQIMLNTAVLNPDVNKVKVRTITDTDAVGVEITEEDGTVRRFMFNIQADGRRMHLNSNAVIDGFETDAYLFMRTMKPDEAEKTFLATASYHRRHGQPGFGVFTKKTTEFCFDEERTENATR